MKSNDSPEIPDRGETSDIPGLPSGAKASVMILSRNMPKRVGESRHPCRTPNVVQNQSPMLPLKRTALVALL